MRKTVCILCALLFMGTMMSYAQQDTIKPEGYKFTDVKRLPATSVKDQYRAGTCWSWATTSFLESEMMRMGKDSVNLSAMYFVKHAYSDKAEKVCSFARGSEFRGRGSFFRMLPIWQKNTGLCLLKYFRD